MEVVVEEETLEVLQDWTAVEEVEEAEEIMMTSMTEEDHSKKR